MKFTILTIYQAYLPKPEDVAKYEAVAASSKENRSPRPSRSEYKPKENRKPSGKWQKRYSHWRPNQSDSPSWDTSLVGRSFKQNGERKFITRDDIQDETLCREICKKLKEKIDKTKDKKVLYSRCYQRKNSNSGKATQKQN